MDDGDNALKLLRGEVTGTLAQINIGLLADQVGVAATDTLYLGQGVHDLLLSIDVCVQQTDDVLEAVASQHCCSHTHYSQDVQSSSHSQACAQSATPMQASLPFPDSMLSLQHCMFVVHRPQRLILISSSFSMLSWIEERPCVGWRAHTGAGVVASRFGESIVDVLQCNALLGTYLDFSPETSAV